MKRLKRDLKISYAIEQDKLRKDVPWKRVEELKNEESDFTRRFRHVTGFFNAKDVADCMDKMSKQGIGEYLGSINEKIAEVNDRMHQAGQADMNENIQANQKQNKKPVKGRK